MKGASILNVLQNELGEELYEHILPYWMEKTIDTDNGGFYGKIDNYNRPVENAQKGAILNARILWTFAAVYRITGDDAYRAIAERAYEYIEKYFWDHQYGGVYWMIDYAGKPVDKKKHCYAQAFAIYAYSEYFKAVKQKHALDRAIELFKILEEKCYEPDYGGYYEAFSDEWKKLTDVRLNDEDERVARSMNTHLHLIEAFSNLYKCWPDDTLSTRMGGLVELLVTKPVFNSSYSHFLAFFDNKWNPVSNLYSYGHDIEGGWLLYEAANTIGNKRLTDLTAELMTEIAEVTLTEGMDKVYGGIYNAGENGFPTDTNKQWWIQAEAIVGFLDAYKKSGNADYLEAAGSLWEFIKNKVVDREHGEWFFMVTREGTPLRGEDKVGEWKCPYHTARACIETVNRTKALISVSGQPV